MPTPLNFSKLAIRQLDRSLEPWRRPDLGRRPVGGWIKAIRATLGMTSVALAERLGMTPAGLRKLETAEVEGTISLRTLQKVAAALDCEVRYALVPKRTLEESITTRARQIARKRIDTTHATMALEDQAIGADAREEQEALLTESLLQGARRDLWK